MKVISAKILAAWLLQFEFLKLRFVIRSLAIYCVDEAHIYVDKPKKNIARLNENATCFLHTQQEEL